MASEGPLSPDSGADDAAVGTLTWISPGNITASDDIRTSAGPPAMGTEETHYLVATDFDFAIPTGATINGIVVEWEVGRLGTGSPADAKARIVKGGAIGSTDRASATVWDTTDAYISHATGLNDLWGETWTDADVNATTFGAALSANCPTTCAVQVDHCRITVHYTEAGASLAVSSISRLVNQLIGR